MGTNLGMVFLFFSMFCFVVCEGNGLSYDFYEASCPQLESIVRGALTTMVVQDPTTPSALLRLMFHDCQVQGCDASILLDSPNSEMGSDKNFGIRRREAIGVIKSLIEAHCPRLVSCADILILAARDSVAMSGGPQIRVPLGRRDSTSTSYTVAEASLPLPNAGIDEMLQIFSSKGMTIDESVAILGGHTLGVTHCHSILDRLQTDPFLRVACPLGHIDSNQTLLNNDITPVIFDNDYHRRAMVGQGVLRIDADMSSDPRTAPIMARFALNHLEFFDRFSSAFIKLSSSGVLTGDQGVIRQSCNIVK